ncbi:MAG: AraC family transcriptional regulator [Nitratireductor sp.]
MATLSLLFQPPSDLAGCVFAGIYRDTRGVILSDRDRFNHFPASPLVSVSRVLHGSLQVVSDGGSRIGEGEVSTLMVMGPTETPVSSWSAGEVAAISVGLFHDAWLCLGGDAKFEMVPQVFDDALTAFGEAPDPHEGWRSFCEILGKEWHSRRPSGWTATHSIADWARAAMNRAALGAAGRSLRSLDRRLRRMSGQSRRSLDFFSSFEALHEASRSHSHQSLAEIAYASGFADQSHMGRAVKRATGFTPDRLNKAIRYEEPFWCYRLLGERF